MSDPILWFRHPGDCVDAAGAHYSTKVKGTCWRIEKDGRQWALWEKRTGWDEFILWGVYDTAKAAKAEVAGAEGMETA